MGEGSTAIVREGFNKQTSAKMAMKIIGKECVKASTMFNLIMIYNLLCSFKSVERVIMYLMFIIKCCPVKCKLNKNDY